MTVRANFEALEGTLNGASTLTLARRSRQLIITNDSTTDMSFKLNSSETYGTLKPTETITMDVSTRTLYLSGYGAYRVWVYG